ncbi:MAG: c-type cytochrome [bacterium]|nr:c-type cytochrome [bacterium]
MNRYSRIILLPILVVMVTGLLSCSLESRDERRARARERQGIILAALEPLVVDSPSMQLYKSHTCNTCHGDDGITPLLPSYPVLARQNEGYVLKQLREIKNGERANGQSSVMAAVVANVPDEDFVVLAAFIADELGDGAPIGKGTPDPESPGATLFKRKTCTACHGKDAVTPLLATYPKVAGHGKEYAIQQMMDIKNGIRANGMNVLGMKGIMHLVTEEEIGQLAAYLETMPRPAPEPPAVEETTE